MQRLLGDLLKALFAEGLLNLPAGASRSSSPMSALRRQISGDAAATAALDRCGWFDPDQNLYAKLHARLESSAARHGSSFADEAISEMLLRPETDRAGTRSLVRDAGAMIGREELLAGKVTMERAVRLLFTMAWRKQIDFARSAHPDRMDAIGLMPQVAYAMDQGFTEAGADVSVAGTLVDAITDPNDRLGQMVLNLMRDVARHMYAGWRRYHQVPPMTRFISYLASGHLPSCNQLAGECEMTDTSLRQRHVKPFFQSLAAAAKSWERHGEVVTILQERGCSRDDAEGWAEGWGTSLVQRRAPKVEKIAECGPNPAKAAIQVNLPEYVPAALAELERIKEELRAIGARHEGVANACRQEQARIRAIPDFFGAEATTAARNLSTRLR